MCQSPKLLTGAKLKPVDHFAPLISTQAKQRRPKYYNHWAFKVLKLEICMQLKWR